jgi:hypothetical protein
MSRQHQDAREANDIVQVRPDMDLFGGCFAVVAEVKENGRVLAYVQSAGVAGQAYLFLSQGDYELTGGRAVWVAGGPGDE